MRFLSRRAPEDDPVAEGAPASDGPQLLFDGQILARWFIEYRLTQEVDRAKRYHRPLSVLIAVPTLLSEEKLIPAALDAAVAAAVLSARESDLVGWIGEDRILAIMPETSAEHAEVALSRWRNEMWLRSRGVGGQKWQLVMLDELMEFNNIITLDRTLKTRVEQQRAA